MTNPVRTTPRSTVRRLRERGSYDRAVVHEVLDEALICHVGFAIDGQPFVIPTIHARLGDLLYLHGAPANHMLKSLRDGVEACVTVTLVDGLVLARSAFHHSVNYRSVCLFGRAAEVTDREEKRCALDALVDHVLPGRADDARRANERELQGVLVLRLPIDEASAKVRTGPPLDDLEDVELDIWAGVVPLRTMKEPPVRAPDLRAEVDTPPYLAANFASYVGHGPFRRM
ncbi:MAG TPA: pyridoxamine 5'-phosphate oxidase family protein [Acidimicrobiales bacterium]|nr:pyridoxamine 5'-phosphate oxidase family protein [Acidimicrobiales bacterium]